MEDCCGDSDVCRRSGVGEYNQAAIYELVIFTCSTQDVFLTNKRVWDHFKVTIFFRAATGEQIVGGSCVKAGRCKIHSGVKRLNGNSMESNFILGLNYITALNC